ncbi:unnamed protein product, partial [marine sediment metagenome]
MDDIAIEKISALENQLSHHKFMVASLMRDKSSFENMGLFERFIFFLTKT